MNVTELKGLNQDQLIAKIMAMKAQAQRKLSLKVTEKGGVSMYGLGKFPVTLYASQWERLLGDKEAVLAFLADNAPLLARKDG